MILKSLYLLYLVLFCFTNLSCAQDEGQSVYLKVDQVTVSSFDTTPDWAPPPNSNAAIDGNLLTRWSSNYTDNQWICFDFGRQKVLNKMIIFWEAAYAVDYNILVSLDNQNWQVLRALEGQDGNMDEIEFSPTQARYVKILGKKRFNPDWGISFWEVLFFGLDRDNPQDKPLSEIYPQLLKNLTNRDTIVKQEIEEPLDSPAVITQEEFQKGVVYTSWSTTELDSLASDTTLEYLKDLGLRHLGIMIVWVQDDIEAKNIYPDLKDTPNDKALIHAINKAHSLGMKVMLKPHVDLKNGQWRGEIIPSPEWFASYKNYLIYYARLAGQYNVELFSVGTELVHTTTGDWQAKWKEIIGEIREVYSGKLVYSANWNEYTLVSFWDELDFIGIDAYFPLTTQKDPTRDKLIAAWKRNANTIDKWLGENKINKPVVFTEIGYCSADGTNIQPWKVLSNLPGNFIDQQEQADALDAMLTVCSTYHWFKGFYWWNYFPQERWSPLGYTIRGKRAEEVLSEWLRKL